MMHPHLYSQFRLMEMFHLSMNVTEITNYATLQSKNFIEDDYVKKWFHVQYPEFTL